ncbi:integral peroxisomal membrane peroxin-domain-containing protein [Lipomyces oligophaga]|uniref:integral peroxisomal membrane peroxin-domain-containing protein n=1 Tax=Lipomyces oligophaga TaxID=45792 RepID=UPI0034CE7909
MNYAPRSFREFAALKDMLYGSEETVEASAQQSSGFPNLTDKLMERLFSAALPTMTEASTVSDRTLAERLQDQKNRPPFSVPVMARNFTRLNSRVGVIFNFQYRMFRIFTWRKTTHTLSFLAVYSFVCLHPFLLVVLPFAFILFGVMVPAYVQRHPPPPSPLPAFPVPSTGPPIADAAELKPVPELSWDFFMNMRDLQNMMDDIVKLYDAVVGLLSRPTNFKDEQYSSGVFLTLLVLSTVLFFLAPYIPWRVIFLVVGWLVVSTGHPLVRRALIKSHETYLSPKERKLAGIFSQFVDREIVVDEPPEIRHVEIYELQRQHNIDVDEWDDWLFCSSPYEPMSGVRLAQQRPQGVRFLDETLPPDGWRYVNDSIWKLDLRPEEWVAQQSIVSVQVDSGSKWVYDMTSDQRRGEWRRRRWTRACERQSVTEVV